MLVFQVAENLLIGDVNGNVTVSLLILNIGYCYMNCCVIIALICTWVWYVSEKFFTIEFVSTKIKFPEYF